MRKRRKVGVGLPRIHILGTVENDNITVHSNLKRHKNMLLRFIEIAKDKVYINYHRRRQLSRYLRMVECTEEVASSIGIGESDDTDKDRERWSVRGSSDIIDQVAGD